ncbi:PAS domain-containing sensor histidine kinase [Litchfieldella xinjiangensis]|uniref:PAS domain-containing sensor histidine kinase n=1 Tax=Litchfieldella xinjiangensis TaxID=1166948 RepID=UPI0005BA164A|nr:PAS domain S-box protein [Halomonas xinjiangensis]
MQQNERGEAERQSASRGEHSTDVSIGASADEHTVLKTFFSERGETTELGQFSSALHTLLTATDIATLFLDSDLRILRFTPQIVTLFDIHAADRGRPLSAVSHRFGCASLSDDANRVLQHQIPIDREIHNGAGRWHLARVRPYCSTEGDISGVVITFVDITKHKRHEDQLLESEERFRVLVDTSAQIIWTTDADGVVVEGSRSWQEFTGQSFAQFCGAGWLDAVHPDDRDHARVQWHRCVESGAPFQTVFRVFHAPSGRYRWTDVRARALRGPDGEIRSWVGMNMDINEQKLAERALKDMNETLEVRVEERTAQVRDLASRLTMAEQEERRRVSQILHDDLQQLLYGIQMKMRMLQEKLAAGDQTLTTMVVDTQSWLAEAIEMTRQLTVDLSPPILKTEGLAESLEWLQRQMYQLHALKVSLHTRRAPYMPNEDLRVLLFQTVRELLFNIKKHAGVDHAEIELDQNDTEILVRVIDHGRGFDQKIMQAEQDEAPGFGLISSRERLSLFGGAMEIHSVPGDGTSILIRVPSERCHTNA